MALIMHCPNCCRATPHDGSGYCIVCKEEDLRLSKATHMEVKSKMHIEDRVAAIESELFDLIPKIERLVSEHKRY